MPKTSHDSATPAHGQQVISACAFIHYNFDGTRKVFLPKRADSKQFLPGVYELPGGHIDFGEDIIDGLKREIREEFEMSINVGDPYAAFTYQNLIKGSHSIEVVYFATFVESIENIIIHPDDHSGYQWFSKDDVVKSRAVIVHEQGDHATYKATQDPEYLAILRGFELLGGKPVSIN